MDKTNIYDNDKYVESIYQNLDRLQSQENITGIEQLIHSLEVDYQTNKLSEDKFSKFINKISEDSFYSLIAYNNKSLNFELLLNTYDFKDKSPGFINEINDLLGEPFRDISKTILILNKLNHQLSQVGKEELIANSNITPEHAYTLIKKIDNDFKLKDSFLVQYFDNPNFSEKSLELLKEIGDINFSFKDQWGEGIVSYYSKNHNFKPELLNEIFKVSNFNNSSLFSFNNSGHAPIEAILLKENIKNIIDELNIDKKELNNYLKISSIPFFIFKQEINKNDFKFLLDNFQFNFNEIYNDKSLAQIIYSNNKELFTENIDKFKDLGVYVLSSLKVDKNVLGKLLENNINDRNHKDIIEIANDNLLHIDYKPELKKGLKL